MKRHTHFIKRCSTILQSFDLNNYAQFMRYIIIGVIQNSLGYIVYLLVTSTGVDPKLTISILYPIGFVISYIGNKKWTFSDTRNHTWAIMRFIVTHIIGYAFNLSALYIFVDIYGFNHQYVQLGAMFILVFYFFLVLRTYVFNKPHNLKSEVN